MSIANYFTLTRIFISPIFLLVYMGHESIGISQEALPYTLLVLFILSELSDACDGYFARKLDQVTDLGKVLDPMADSISRISMFLTFTLYPVNLPIPVLFVFLYRDSVVSTLRTICALKGFALAARKSGKIKAAIQAGATLIVLLLMIPHSLGTITTATLQNYSMLVISVAALYTIYSGYDYIHSNWQHIARLLWIKKSN